METSLKGISENISLNLPEETLVYRKEKVPGAVLESISKYL